MNEVGATNNARSAIEKKFQKPLDKSKRMCYNKGTNQGELNSTNRERVDTMTEKMTYRKALDYAIANLPADAPADVLDKLNALTAQLDKKAASPKKLTAAQEANIGVKDAIMAFLSDNVDTGYTCSDLLKLVPELEGKSNQYASALMRQLVDAKLATKYTDKRRTYFKAA